MSYTNIPTSEQPSLSMNGTDIELNSYTNMKGCPEAIRTLLINKLGWDQVHQHPDTFEALFTKNDQGNSESGTLVDLTAGNFYTWSEAMAYEFAKFLNIGLES